MRISHENAPRARGRRHFPGAGARKCSSPFPLPSYISGILARFDAAGYEAYCVGGCVRDTLRGAAPHDWDLCTSALPDQTLALFADRPCLTVGLKHGTVTVLWDGQPVEITTYRCDGAYVGHRAPSTVTFTPSLREDCRRRDFTVNAMAYHPTRGLADFFGGAADLSAGLLRCVGDPAERFDEDALRILRALRFSSVLDFAIDGDTAAALHRCAPLLTVISGERIYAEFCRMLTGFRAAALLSDYADVIAVFYPPLAACAGQKQRLAAVFAQCRSAETRLSAALCLCGCTAEAAVRSTVSRLPVERKFLDTITALTQHVSQPPPRTRTEMRRMMSQSSNDRILGQLELHAALFPEDSSACAEAAACCRAIADAGDATRVSQLAVNGRDLASLGFRGRAIGDVLQNLLDAVMEEALDNTADALLAYAKTLSTHFSDKGGE